MLSLDEFLNKYDESIYEDYSSSIIYACFNNNTEILEWLNNNFVKEDFLYCQNILEDLAIQGNFVTLEWLYFHYKEIFDNHPFISYLLEEKIIFKIKLLKYYFNDNFNHYIGTFIKNCNIEKILENFFKLFISMKQYMKTIIVKICNVGDVEMLKFLMKYNYFNDNNYILNYIENINKYHKNKISDLMLNNMLNFDNLSIK